MKLIFLKKYKEEIIISAFFFVLALIFNNYAVIGDGRVYYQVLEQKIFHNLNPYPLESVYIQEGGYQQFGASFFWAPFYCLSLFLSKFSLFNFAPLMINGNFVSIYTIFINLAVNFYTLLTLFLALRILRLYNVKGNKIFVILAIFISTPLFVYSIPLAPYNHAINTFILTLFVYLFLIWKDKKPFFQFFLGILIAIGVFIRYLNISIFIFLLFYYFFQKKIQYAKFLLLGFLSFIWFLPVSLYVVNGSVVRPLTIIMGETNFPLGKFNLIPKYALKLLLHPIHGLFVWSPITILSFYGLIHYYQEDKKTAMFFIGIFLSLIFLQGCFYNWHAGWSFSQRYLTGMFPVFVFGFGYFLSKFPKLGFILGTIFTVYTLFLLLNWGTVIHGELGTPIDMFQAWSSGKVEFDLILNKVNKIKPFLR